MHFGFMDVILLHSDN